MTHRWPRGEHQLSGRPSPTGLSKFHMSELLKVCLTLRNNSLQNHIPFSFLNDHKKLYWCMTLINT